MDNRILNLFNIQYPIIQAGMVWCSGWKLAHAVSEAGGLGIIGAGSMSPSILQEHISKFKLNSSKPFAVNLPLIYNEIESQIDIIIKNQVPIVFTSAGNPNLYTKKFKDNGIKVVHVVSSVKFAVKAQDAGVDAIVGEGFEAGGHNGREETTTFCLIPAICDSVNIPVIAAGGIGCGRTMLAAMILGASAVQIGSLFAISKESSAHDLFKQKVISLKEGDTELTLKSLNPVRLIKNEFYELITQAEKSGSTPDQLKQILGKGRSRLGIFEGDLVNGELEIGQLSSRIRRIDGVVDIMNRLISEYNSIKMRVR